MDDQELKFLSTAHKRLSVTGISLPENGTDGNCVSCYHHMLQKNQVLKPNPTAWQNIKYGLSFPPHDEVSSALTWVIAIPMLWVILYSITGDEALPGGNLFSILSLLLLAQMGGYIASFLHLPPLLGMLLVGIAVRSLPGLDIIGHNIDGKWSATLRKTALVVILTKAGLGLDPKALRELSVMVLKVGIFPNIVETSVVAIIAHYLLNFPWLWSFMLGFVLAGVSPSVVVPCILGLSDDGYGLDKGVPTLIIAGLSVDNVISISGFGVMLGMVFSEGSIVWQIAKGPLEILTGIAFGIVMGSLLWYLPNRHEKGFSKFRFVLLLACGLFSVFGSKKIGFAGCGPLGCLATSFVAAIGWRKQGWMDSRCPIKKNYNFLWKFCLPLLFGLIGSEIQISALNMSTVGYGLLMIVVSISFRFAVTFFVVRGEKFNVKERLFIAISWIPKATIQAAIGSTALETARHFRGDGEEESEEEILGKQLLTIAVLAILVAAPLGAAAIMLAGPKLLSKQEEYVEVPLQEKVDTSPEKV